MPIDAGLYILPVAFILDFFLGDPKNLPHPVRWMGKAIETLEPPFRKLPFRLTYSGMLFAISLATGTWICAAGALAIADHLHPILKIVLEITGITYCLASRSLNDAAMQISRDLQQHHIGRARDKVALIVGRDVTQYEEEGIARATVETVAENLVDGVIAPLFFAALGGAPLALTYKMINTLDSMVGYKNELYRFFGKGAAKIDDLANYIPARLAVPIIALAAQILSGQGARAFKTAFQEGHNHSSPNAGLPEAAFAGALAVKLNGPNIYNGQRVDKPYIGSHFGRVCTRHIKNACDIMILASVFGLICFWVMGLLVRAVF